MEDIMGGVVGTVVFNTAAVDRPHASDFWRGARAAFNLSGSTTQDYHFASSAEDADDAAVTNDWEAVGEDLTASMAHTH